MSDDYPLGVRTDLYVYVASSWRCSMHSAVVAALDAADIPHYNFRDADGFRWSDIGIDSREEAVDKYLKALRHPVSFRGFNRDMAALMAATHVVLVQPCGRSAHLELGWAVGQGKRTAVFLEPVTVTPDLMYLMCDDLITNMMDLLAWLGVTDG